MRLLQVEAPVFVPVAAGADGAQLEHGFGYGQPPSRTGAAHSIPHEMAACSLNDPGGDGQTLGKELRVVDVDGVLVQILDGFVDRIAVGAGEPSISRGS